MIDRLLSIVAPHYCCGCDKIGSLLCDNCKYNIICETKIVCAGCGRPTTESWTCGSCRQKNYDKLWLVGERQGALQRIIGLYKFERAIEAYRQLADLLDKTLPVLPENTILVPIPTTSGRIRERGYDHMYLVAKRLAKLRGLKCEQLIKRRSDSKQRHASAEQRQAQAKSAFAVDAQLDDTVPYLVVDDVITTGATVKYAAKALSSAGAKQIWAAVLARQVANDKN